MLSNATIAANGKLAKEHVNLEKMLPRTVNNKKTVLLLGSGMVAAPLVDRLCSRSDVQVVIGMSLHTRATVKIKTAENIYI